MRKIRPTYPKYKNHRESKISLASKSGYSKFFKRLELVIYNLDLADISLDDLCNEESYDFHGEFSGLISSQKLC